MREAVRGRTDRTGVAAVGHGSDVCCYSRGQRVHSDSHNCHVRCRLSACRGRRYRASVNVCVYMRCILKAGIHVLDTAAALVNWRSLLHLASSFLQWWPPHAAKVCMVQVRKPKCWKINARIEVEKLDPINHESRIDLLLV